MNILFLIHGSTSQPKPLLGIIKNQKLIKTHSILRFYWCCSISYFIYTIWLHFNSLEFVKKKNLLNKSILNQFHFSPFQCKYKLNMILSLFSQTISWSNLMNESSLFPCQQFRGMFFPRYVVFSREDKLISSTFE